MSIMNNTFHNPIWYQSFTPRPNEVISITNNANSLLHINMSNVSKLTSTNYLMWSLQVHALLDGSALAKHLDANAVIPAQNITIDDVLVPSPEFVH